jgi:hypothetical protein
VLLGPTGWLQGTRHFSGVQDPLGIRLEYKGLPFGLVKVARIILNVAYKQGKPVVTGKDVGYFQVTLYLQESEQFVNRVMVNE